MQSQTKAINLILADGTLQGVVTVEDSSWKSGVLYSVPRPYISILLAGNALTKHGVYLLLSAGKIFVGQSATLSSINSERHTNLDWWENVVLLTTKDNSLTQADCDYIDDPLSAERTQIQC